MSSNSVIRSRRTMLIMLAVFILPVILAKLALDQDWFNKGATNKGLLLSPPLSVQALLGDLTPKWRLVYVQSTSCDQACENALFAIQQVWLALGREQERAEPLLILSEGQVAPASVTADGPIRLISAASENVKELFNPVGADGIFIIDTQGNAVLKYPLEQEQQQAVLKSRDILADLRKLLKLSRIG